MCLPVMDSEPLGYTLLTVSIIWSGWALVRLVGTLRNRIVGDTRRNILRRYLATLLGFGLIAYAAFNLAVGRHGDTTYIASGAMLLLISATISSWELLTKVAEDKFKAEK
jgi:hypothetical protein